MSETIYRQCNLNLRQEVLDLLDGECELRNNGARGRSLTVNQILMEYFRMVTPRGTAVGVNETGKPVLTINEAEA